MAMPLLCAELINSYFRHWLAIVYEKVCLIYREKYILGIMQLRIKVFYIQVQFAEKDISVPVVNCSFIALMLPTLMF